MAVKCDLYLYADDPGLVCIGKDIKIIEANLNNNFNSLCNWFIGNKLSIQFGEDKMKSILFGTEWRFKGDAKLEINRGEIKIKQHYDVNYLVPTFREEKWL